jgi:hypothetical protein
LASVSTTSWFCWLRPVARLLAHGGKFLGRLDERRAIGQHQVVALAVVIEAEVAGHHQAGFRHQPYLHPLVTLQQLAQALARHRQQIHRSRDGPLRLGHHQLVGVELGLVEIPFTLPETHTSAPGTTAALALVL